MSGYSINWRRVVAGLCYVLMCIHLLLAVLLIVVTRFSDALDSFAYASLNYFIAIYLSRQAHLHDFDSITEVYIKGKLVMEERRGAKYPGGVS